MPDMVFAIKETSPFLGRHCDDIRATYRRLVQVELIGKSASEVLEVGDQIRIITGGGLYCPSVERHALWINGYRG